MLPIEKLNRDILKIHADPNLSDTDKQNKIHALVEVQRAGAYTTGASIHYYTGESIPSADSLTTLSAIRVAIAHRNHKGKPDGIGGSAGGLAKRIASTRLDGASAADGITPKYPDETRIIKAFGRNVLSADLLKQHPFFDPELKQDLLNVFDDVIEGADGRLAVTDDMGIILDKNIRREAREELGAKAYAMMQPVLNSAQFHIALTGIDDDLYVCTPAWWKDNFENDGLLAYPCTATTTFLKIEPAVFDALIGLTKNMDFGDGEITGLTAIPLVELLTRLSVVGHGHPAHDPQRHYRHGHEGFVPWKIAAELLGRDAVQMAALVRDIAPRYKSDNRLDFQKIAQSSQMTLADMDQQFGFVAGTFSGLQDVARQSAAQPKKPDLSP